MNWIWLSSAPPFSDSSPILLFNPGRVTQVRSVAEVLDQAASGHHSAIVVDVAAGDEPRAQDALEALSLSGVVIIYQPSATVEGTAAFLEHGASQVCTNPAELHAALLASPDKYTSGQARALSAEQPGRAMRAVTDAVALVAARTCTVLIEGETGTGKEVVARNIHRGGNRSSGPFIALNCGAIPEALLEAELFGHTRGAFTGAVQPRIGKFEAAQRGTILLDEIGDMPLSTQAKLLRVLQEKEIERLGGNEKVRLDVRVLAATNVNLAKRVDEGRFRQDLYYRLNVFQIVIPPLRERRGEIPALASHFLSAVCIREHLSLKELSACAIGKLLEHDWPGNVRELENIIEAAAIRSLGGGAILASDIQFGRASSSSRAPGNDRFHLPAGGLNYQEAIESLEHQLLTQALARTRGNKTAAADLLQLKRTTLSARMRALSSRMPRLAA